jgi:hypothetical protein
VQVLDHHHCGALVGQLVQQLDPRFLELSPRLLRMQPRIRLVAERECEDAAAAEPSEHRLLGLGVVQAEPASQDLGERLVGGGATVGQAAAQVPGEAVVETLA